MMKTIFTFATLAALTATAAAETQTPDVTPIGKDGYLGLGLEFGAQRDLKAGVLIDGGLRVSDSPFYVHARYVRGASGIDFGRYQQGRVGLEARQCSGWACGFAGLDVGYQYDHHIEDDFCIKGDTGGGCEGSRTETFAHEILVVPRVGLEFGKRVKFRITLDVPVAKRLDMEETTKGGLVMAGVAYSW